MTGLYSIVEDTLSGIGQIGYDIGNVLGSLSGPFHELIGFLASLAAKAHEDCCCVASLTPHTSGKFEGDKTIIDYFPKAKDDFPESDVSKAGRLVEFGVTHFAIQFTSVVTGSSDCPYMQSYKGSMTFGGRKAPLLA